MYIGLANCGVNNKIESLYTFICEIQFVFFYQYGNLGMK